MARPRPPRHALLALALALPLHTPLMLAGAAGLAAPAAVVAQPVNASSDLPIKSITLYRSGVGCFERRGLVDGDTSVQLRFATDQMNDILKSMVIFVAADKGRVQSVSYGSKDPLQKRLASFGIDLSDDPTLATMLTRLRGAKVKFTLPDAVVEGLIVGGEVREQAQGNAQKPIAVPFVNVLTSQGVRSVNLTTMVAVDILDAALRDELAKALSALAEHRADRVKAVDVAFSGQGQYPAIIGYIHEMPMWKTSYRLVLPDEGKGETGGPTIQGWALVENTTDEDWEQVKLSLVAGRPVSFTMDLYEPLRVARPEVPVPMVAGVVPRVYQATEQIMQEAAAAARARGGGNQMFARRDINTMNAPGAPAAKAAEGAYMSAGGFGDVTLAAPQAIAAAGEVGEVFQYQLKEPVSIARQRSAMLPILSAGLEGRRVSIFNRADGSENPMRGVEVRNTSGLQLMPGPITVFDGSAYAGDAQISHVTAGEKRLLAYAVDLDVRAVVKDENRSALRSVRIVRGLLEHTYKEEATVSYAFSNRDQKRVRTILVEHPKPGDRWELVEPAKPKEETRSLYRFELEAAPASSVSLPLKFERVNSQTFELASFSLDTLLGYAKDGKASPAVVDMFKKAAAMKAAADDTRNQIARLDQERSAISEDQNRIRQNIGSVGRDTELYRRYTSKLNEQETRLEQIREAREKAQSTLLAQENELREFLQNLNVG